MIVRPATPADVPRLVEMGEEMRRESVVPFPDINRDMVALVASELFPRRDVYCALVAEEDGDLAGMMTGFTAYYVFSPTVVAQHDILYVRPGQRGTRAARLLIKGFIGWAREIGAARAILAVHTGIAPEKTGRFYRMLGFTHMGGIYFQEVI